MLFSADKEELLKVCLLHYGRYPAMQVKDLLKLLFQNEFGAEHLISDEVRSLQGIRAELETMPDAAKIGEAVESIGNGYCRVYLRAIEQGILSTQDLNRIFIETAGKPCGSREGFDVKASYLLEFCANDKLPFNRDELQKLISELHGTDYAPVRHSAIYRENYAPAYRVVSCSFVPSFMGECKGFSREK